MHYAVRKRGPKWAVCVEDRIALEFEEVDDRDWP